MRFKTCTLGMQPDDGGTAHREAAVAAVSRLHCAEHEPVFQTKVRLSVFRASPMLR